MASNVPTPQQVKQLKEEKLKKPFTRTHMQDRDSLFQELWRFLQKIESKWVNFADQLGIDKSKIATFKANYLAKVDTEASSREMLSKWIESTTRANRKWSTIKEAARKLQLIGLVESLNDAGVKDDEEPSMKDLQTLVIPEITFTWYDFGMKLKVRTAKLNTIKTDHGGGDGVKECMRSVVDHWLKSTTSPAWDHVISALNKMEETQLADEITDYISPC